MIRAAQENFLGLASQFQRSTAEPEVVGNGLKFLEQARVLITHVEKLVQPIEGSALTLCSELQPSGEPDRDVTCGWKAFCLKRNT